MKKTREEFILVGDIGGTKTHLAIISSKKYKITHQKIISSNQISSITKTINKFLTKFQKENKKKIKKACFGLAGPLNLNRTKCKLTNLPITINTKTILKKTQLSQITLINDFEAIGFGVPLLKSTNLIKLNNAKTKNKETIGVIGPGTGLGKSIIIWNNSLKKYIPLPSEGCQADFSATTKQSLDLALFIQKKHKLKNPIDAESVISGPGIINIFKFLIKNKTKNKVHKEILKTKDPSKISKNNKDKICNKTLELFTKFCAQCASNFTLDILSTGGLFLAGGIPIKNKKYFKKYFLKEFIKNNTQSHQEILKKTPIYIIKTQKVNLLGATNACINFPELSNKK